MLLSLFLCSSNFRPLAIVYYGTRLLYILMVSCSGQQFDIDAKNNLEQTALHLASKGDHDSIVKLLLDNNANDSIIDKAM